MELGNFTKGFKRECNKLKQQNLTQQSPIQPPYFMQFKKGLIAIMPVNAHYPIYQINNTILLEINPDILKIGKTAYGSIPINEKGAIIMDPKYLGEFNKKDKYLGHCDNGEYLCKISGKKNYISIERLIK